MDTSLSVQVPSIYTGAWINWSEGRIKGGTLTLSARNAAILVAFLALYVRLAGDCLWNIVSFIIFLLRSSAELRDGLYHQQQVALKTPQSDISAFWHHCRLGWVWKQALGADVAFRKSIGLALLALLHTALLVAAGLFSSRVASTVSDVLLNEVSCGSFPAPDYQAIRSSAEGVYSFAAVSGRVQRNLATASGYAASCYRSSNVDISWSDCHALGKTRVQWNQTTVPCPFGADLCKADAVQFDTGPISSHMDFGINAPPEDRISYRRIMQCAAINTDGYRKGPLDSASSGIPEGFRQVYDSNETWHGYFYGPNLNLNSSATYYVSTRRYPQTDVSTSSIRDVLSQYELAVQTSSVQPRANSFEPIPELVVPNANTVLLFLHKNTAYFEPVNDPWFRSLQAVTAPIPLPDGTTTVNMTVYSDPEAVSVLGCTESAQWCNPHTGKCISVAAGDNAFPAPGMDSLKLSPRQNATMARIAMAAGPTSLLPVITFLGAPSLLAAKAAAVDSPKLADDQWKQELEHWLSTGMAALQLDILQFVTGEASNPLQSLYQIPPTEDNAWMCRNQITQRTDHVSFSMLGLCLILVVGGLTMLTNFFLSEVLVHRKSFLQSRRGRHWVLSGGYQMQARIFDLTKSGGEWIHMGTSHPVTKTNERFQHPFSVAEKERPPLYNQPPPFFDRWKDRSDKPRTVDSDYAQTGSTFELTRQNSDFGYGSPVYSRPKPERVPTNMTAMSTSEAASLLDEQGYRMSYPLESRP